MIKIAKDALCYTVTLPAIWIGSLILIALAAWAVDGSWLARPGHLPICSSVELLLVGIFIGAVISGPLFLIASVSLLLRAPQQFWKDILSGFLLHTVFYINNFADPLGLSSWFFD